MSCAAEFHPDNEFEYLQLHVRNLEVIICELLAKNERLRQCWAPDTQNPGTTPVPVCQDWSGTQVLRSSDTQILRYSGILTTCIFFTSYLVSPKAEILGWNRVWRTGCRRICSSKFFEELIWDTILEDFTMMPLP